MIDDNTYAITCARLISGEGIVDVKDTEEIGNTLGKQVNKLAEMGYRPIDMTSSRDIACVLMKRA